MGQRTKSKRRRKRSNASGGGARNKKKDDDDDVDEWMSSLPPSKDDVVAVNNNNDGGGGGGGEFESLRKLLRESDAHLVAVVRRRREEGEETETDDGGVDASRPFSEKKMDRKRKRPPSCSSPLPAPVPAAVALPSPPSSDASQKKPASTKNDAKTAAATSATRTTYNSDGVVNNNNEDDTTETPEAATAMLLSAEFLRSEQHQQQQRDGGYSTTGKYSNNDADCSYNVENPLMVLPSSKKKNKQQKQQTASSLMSSAVELTCEEIREARRRKKDADRKLRQLEAQKLQKEKRQRLYDDLERTSISEQARSLLLKSSSLGITMAATTQAEGGTGTAAAVDGGNGKHDNLPANRNRGKKMKNKKQVLQRLLRKERAGIVLNDTERDLLYRRRTDDGGTGEDTGSDDDGDNEPEHLDDEDGGRAGSLGEQQGRKVDKESGPALPEARSSKKCKPRQPEHEQYETMEKKNRREDNNGADSMDDGMKVTERATALIAAGAATSSTKAAASSSSSSSSFAAQMMVSLSKLKSETEQQRKKATEEEAELRRERERKQQEEDARLVSRKERYVPKDPAVLKTAATLGLSETKGSTATGVNRNGYRVMEICRPSDVQASRYDLPVLQMEYEVVDAVRNNDVVIICGETGSGKSTQVPQLLYEAGMTLPKSEGRGAANPAKDNSSQDFLIGITQPRRVAAVSTAKRVCYEMGKGNGQSIVGGRVAPIDGASAGTRNRPGNLVAYQTRYETAGMGTDTRIKFMTDGLLLQEIQSDLLLRKYSVIVLDEAHERNLNTDVLIGLLSAAIPLRKQAASEPDSDIVPLKLVIMSATLRVQDFTTRNTEDEGTERSSSTDDKKRLFASCQTPTILTIPGRAFPVTIHHSKVTEMENYEDVAYRKICKIHRQLPQGGILVFLTGKQEILRMVHRLRRALMSPSSDTCASKRSSPMDVTEQGSDQMETALRDLDDEELDGDLFQDDGEALDNVDEDVDTGVVRVPGESGPEKTRILPLYSLLSSEDQAKVFDPVPPGHRLIVVATNVAETSITIPGISYVVDCGRQKCRNYASGVISYDVMWISKAAADQRAGRAGRTGPGHCYRLYSSTMYARHMDPFGLPEVLTRPLEDVVLSLKAMAIKNITNFPFPTPPPSAQLEPAIQLLANLGCVNVPKVEERGNNIGDGVITRLGAAVAKLPVGVRFGKMLLVAAQVGVLDYAIATVAAASECNIFVSSDSKETEDSSDVTEEPDKNDPTVDSGREKRRWKHRGGDMLAATLVVGAYAYAGRGMTAAAQKRAHQKFCDENGISFPVMERITKMRNHLARLARARLSNSGGVAAKTGGFNDSMSPPNTLQERLLRQAIASGLLDNIAVLAPLGSIPGEHPFSLRTAYLRCSTRRREPFFLDHNSVIFSRDSRVLPKWVCYESLLRKNLRDGTPIAIMKNVTPIDASWLGTIAVGSQLLQIGDPQPTPLPIYDTERDAILCSVTTKFGYEGWEVPSVRLDMLEALERCPRHQTAQLSLEDTFRWFGRFLLEGKVIPELQIENTLNDSPSMVTNRPHLKKVVILVSALSSTGISSSAALRRHWAEVDEKFLFKSLRHWVREGCTADFKKIWISSVRRCVEEWKERH